MSSVYLILPVVLPILGGALMPLFHLPEKQRNLFLEALVLLTSALAILCVLRRPASGFTLFQKRTPAEALAFVFPPWSLLSLCL